MPQDFGNPRPSHIYVKYRVSEPRNNQPHINRHESHSGSTGLISWCFSFLIPELLLQSVPE